MFGNIDPKKINAMMKQMGIAQEEIDATRVIIEKSEGGKIIIENPSVMKVKMQGNVNFQISGEIKEEQVEEQSEEEKQEEDIKNIMEQTGCSKEKAKEALIKNNGDMVEAIISLS